MTQPAALSSGPEAPSGPPSGIQQPAAQTMDREANPIDWPDARLLCPGDIWRDTSGEVIQAHGGGILRHGGAYYWFGEDKSGPTTLNARNAARVPFRGIRAYRSTDLVAWHPLGTVLHPADDDPSHPLHPSKVVERPKVIYNDAGDHFVMWFKAGGADYEYMHLGVATSRAIAGPYQFRHAGPPNGLRAGDFAVQRDADGSAYLIHPSDRFSVMIVARLNDAATGVSGELSRVLRSSGGYEGHEAPAVFQRDGRWYMITSRVSGWAPNPCRVCVAERLTGPWEVMGELCDPQETSDTFASQPACVLQPDTRNGTCIYVGDRWSRESLGDSRYVWLPLVWEGDRPWLRWQERWSPHDHTIGVDSLGCP